MHLLALPIWSTFFVAFTALAFPHAGSIKLPVLRRHTRPTTPLHQRIQRSDVHHIRRAQLTESDAPVTDVFIFTDDTTKDISPLVQLLVGQPPQILQVQLDTAAYTLYLFSSGASGQPVGVNAISLFNANASSSFVASSAPKAGASLAEGNSTGVSGTDTVQLLGTAFNNQSIFVTTLEDLEGADSFDGIFGLLPTSHNASRGPNLLDTLINEGYLAQPVFSFTPLATAAEDAFAYNQTKLGSTYNTSLTQRFFLANSSVLELGGYPQDLNYTYASVVVPQDGSDPEWVIQLDHIAIRGSPVAGTSLPAAISSGASSILFPLGAGQAVARAIGGQLVNFSADTSDENGLGGPLWLAAPCDAEPLTFAVGINGSTFFLNVADLLYDTLDSNGTECLFQMQVAPNPETKVITLLSHGGPLFRALTTAFHFPNDTPPRIGFAQSPNLYDKPVRLADLLQSAPHAGLLNTFGLPQSALTGDAPVPSATSSSA